MMYDCGIENKTKDRQNTKNSRSEITGLISGKCKEEREREGEIEKG